MDSVCGKVRHTVLEGFYLAYCHNSSDGGCVVNAMIDILFCALAVALVKYVYPTTGVKSFYELHSRQWMPGYCEPCLVFWTFVVLKIAQFVVYLIV